MLRVASSLSRHPPRNPAANVLARSSPSRRPGHVLYNSQSNLNRKWRIFSVSVCVSVLRLVDHRNRTEPVCATSATGELMWIITKRRKHERACDRETDRIYIVYFIPYFDIRRAQHINSSSLFLFLSAYFYTFPRHNFQETILIAPPYRSKIDIVLIFLHLRARERNVFLCI